MNLILRRITEHVSTASPDSHPGTGLKLYSIQYLRAVAAAAVVVSHAANSLLGHTSHLIDLDYGAYGVDIFFVVSGCIMYYTTFDTGMRPSTFLVKRLIRIFPLYFVLSTAMLFLVVLSPASFNQESPDIRAYLQSIFFIPHWNPRLHNFEPIIGQGWTLNYEMFFYLLFAASLFLRHRLSGLAVLPIICALVTLGRLYPAGNPVFLTYTSPLMLEFCLGIVVAASFITPASASLRWPIVLMVALGAAIAYLYAFHAQFHASEALRPLFVGLPCTLLVTMLVAIERRGRLPTIAFLALLGDASYSLYLVHGFVLGLGRRLWQRFVAIDSIGSHALFIALILTASVGTALLVYRYLELRIGRILTAAVRRFQAGKAAAAFR
jgi:exopolysaccharide production protein ExoZ